jgi:hypothetical protein
VIAQRYGQIPGLLDTHELVLIVADRTLEALRMAVPAAIAPSAERLASLAKDVLIDGSPAKDWWARQGEDLAFKFAAEVRKGVLDGQTQEQIVARIVGRGDHGLCAPQRAHAGAFLGDDSGEPGEAGDVQEEQ